MAGPSEPNTRSGGMFVSPRARDMNVRKSIKVKLPIRQHIRLHALKLFGENNISQTVEHALDHYFDKLQADGVHLDGIPTPEAMIAAARMGTVEDIDLGDGAAADDE